MNIECSHCGAVNPTDSTFCGECGWQVLPPDVEVEIEESITSAQRKADRDAVRAGPAVKPAGGEAEMDAEPAAGRTETEAGQADHAAAPEKAVVGGEVEFEPAPVAVTTDTEARQAELEIVPEEEPAGGEAEPEPEPLVDRAGLGGPVAVHEVTLAAKPAQEVVSFEDREGVTITGSAAIFGDRIYARADVLSVDMETSRANRLPSLLLAAFGAIILAFAVASLGRDPGLSLILIAGGLALLAIGALLAVTANDQYLVCVRTASGVEAALVSTDRERVQRIVRAMRGGPNGQDLLQQD